MSENQPSSRSNMAWPLAAVTVCLPLVVALIVSGCSSGDGQNPDDPNNPVEPDVELQLFNIGTAPIGGTFPIVGGAIAETLNKHKGDVNWKFQAEGTKGSQANIRGLDSGTLNLALSNSAISYFAVQGEGTWTKKHDIRAVVTLAPNVAMFVTKTDTGVKTIADLKGKRVVIGPAGAGFEMFVYPILEEHGVTEADFTKRSSPMGPAVDLLGDGEVHAAFLGGAVPAAAISQAAASFEIVLVPFDPATRDTLIEKYAFFDGVTVPADVYGLDADFEGLNVGSMHLITSAAADEDLIYQVTKAIWENRAEIAEQHGAGKAINEKNAARFTGTEFHPGAIKFYEEIGIWPEAAPAGNAAGDTPEAAPTEDASPAAEAAPDGSTEETEEKETE